jgi:hypothetical protein
MLPLKAVISKKMFIISGIHFGEGIKSLFVSLKPLSGKLSPIDSALFVPEIALLLQS